MKIGIYGDSFGYYYPEGKQYHWSTILENKLNCNIENYARYGTSLFYSYQKFLETYTKYDLIIFLVTDPYRYPAQLQLSIDNDTKMKRLRFISGVGDIGKISNEHPDKLTVNDKKILRDLTGWFIMSDDLYSREMSELILQKIESLHKNIIFYPCFETSFSKARFIKLKIPNNQVIFDLCKYQIKVLLGTDFSEEKIGKCFANETPRLAGHLIKEMNEYLAEAMLSKINTGIWNYSNLSSLKIKNTTSYYYNLLP
jgi:hypothetical protein